MSITSFNEQQYNYLIECFQNDGYLYIIGNKHTKFCKIGKTSMRNKQNQDIVETKLLQRYSTYDPTCFIIKTIRVGNCHTAEKELIDILTNQHKLHFENEHFYYYGNEDIILNEFNNIQNKYHHIQYYIY